MGNPIGTLLIIAAFAPFSIADNIKSLPSLFDFKAINRSTSLLSNDVVAQVFNDPDVGEIKKEITPNGLLLYVVEDRIKGDYSNVSEEDRLAIIEESKRTNLQLVFNELRAKYNFDEKISVSNQFANQNL